MDSLSNNVHQPNLEVLVCNLKNSITLGNFYITCKIRRNKMKNSSKHYWFKLLSKVNCYRDNSIFILKLDLDFQQGHNDYSLSKQEMPVITVVQIPIGMTQFLISSKCWLKFSRYLQQVWWPRWAIRA